jgi:hypothetical protein
MQTMYYITFVILKDDIPWCVSVAQCLLELYDAQNVDLISHTEHLIFLKFTAQDPGFCVPHWNFYKTKFCNNDMNIHLHIVSLAAYEKCLKM